MQTKKITLSILLLFALFSSFANATLFFSPSHFETGSIKGKILDAEDKSEIIGANLIIKGTILGTSSDLKGNYSFKSIQIGTYEIVCSAIGYQTSIFSIKVIENQTVELNFDLKPSITNLNEVTIESDLPISAASSKQVRKIDISMRPARTSQDMLMLVPGLIIAQHAGGGKAEQIYIRGFDCDHGTDICINVDGMPVNMVSHGHGQGYADLHFLIAETVEDIDVNKGPYFAKYGDFATAAAVSFKTKNILDHNLFKVEAGQFNTQKYTLMYQMDQGSSQQNAYIAAQYNHTDGPFESPQGFERLNVFGKYFTQLSKNSKLTFSAGGFSSTWNASGQIPDRAVKSGYITRFQGIDDLEGGTTGRQNFNLEYSMINEHGDEFKVRTYISLYNFKLFSNFTLYASDTVNGDMIEQIDNRMIHGLNGEYKFSRNYGKIKILNRVGIGYRGDNINNQLWHSPERVRMNLFTNDDIIQRNMFAYVEQEYVFHPKIRIIAGLRQDYFTFNKEDNVGAALDSINNGLPHTSGVAQKSMISPKLNIVFQAMKNLDVYINFGRGFHSNDARDIVIGESIKNLVKSWKNQGLSDLQIENKLKTFHFDSEQQNVNAMPQAIGGELGFRTKIRKKIHIGLSAWYLYLDKEYVFVGDGGTTELSEPTQRLGIDFETRYSITKWLWADADFCWSQGTIIGLPSGANYIPLAPTLTASGGLNFMFAKGLEGTIRFRHVGSRPANEDNSVVALGYTLLNTTFSYKWRNLTFFVHAENLLNSEWNEAQFDTETRLKTETESISELCYTPGNPRNFQFGCSFKF